MKRRSFLKNTGVASASLMMPAFVKRLVPQQLFSSRSGKILIVVQLSGGNDGLNTIIPYQDDLYYQMRPTLGIAKNDVLKISDAQGFNPALAALRSVYDDGAFSIINSVGYPNPDRSHFRSMDIWQTGSSSTEYLSTGWIGRYLDNNCVGCEVPYHALEIDDSLSLAMKGIEHSGFAMRNPKALKRIADNSFLKAVAQQQPIEDHAHDNISYLYKTMIDTQQSAEYLAEKSRVHQSTVKYPGGKFGNKLKMISELITADTDTRIFYVSLGGFDTHVGQKSKQKRLLETYAETMAAFIKDLKSNGLFKDTLIMTFSEFGRRVKQNASGGTDHGTANNVFLMGGNLKGNGFYNSAPNLSELDKGDLIYQIDFRNIYANILEDWLSVKSNVILDGQFDTLGLI